MPVYTGQTVTREFPLSTTAGAQSNADSLPTGKLVLNGVVNAAAVTITNPSTAIYAFSVTLPTIAANDQVQVRVTATVGGVTASADVFEDVGTVTVGELT